MDYSICGRAAATDGARLLLKLSSSVVALLVAGGALAQDAPAAGTPDEDIVVTGFRASIANAIAAKKNSDMIVESISAEDIGKLPDTSIAESIARLPGLAAQREGGRAQSLAIRGLAPDFSTTLLNGREQVTTNDNRGVDYDQFPSEMMERVDVYKTPSAGLIGAGLSGTVDLRTVKPLGHGKRTIALNARAEVLDAGKLNPDSDSWGYRFAGTYIDQFADDTIGIALSGSVLKSPSQTQRFEAWGYPTDASGTATIGGAKPYAISGDLERKSISGTLEWRPNENIQTSVDLFYSNFKDHQTRRGVELPLAWGNGVPLTNVVVEDKLVVAGTYSNVKGVVRNDLKNRDADLFSAGWNLKAGNDLMRATLDFSYSKVDRKDLDVETYSGTGRSYVEGSVSRGATDVMPFEMTDRGPIFSHQLDYSDPSLILLTSPQGWGGDIVPGGQDGYYNNRKITDELAAFRFGAERDLGGWFRSAEIGFNYTGRVKRLTPDEYFLGLKANTDGQTSVPVPSDLLYDGGADMSFLGLGDTIAYDVKGLLDSGIYNFLRNPNADVSTKGWRVREDVMTGYLQLNLDAALGTSRLTGNVGVQLVNTDQRSDGLASSGTGAGVQNMPIRDGASYFYALPTLNLVLRGENDLVARFSAGRQMARARMNEMRASINYNFAQEKALCPVLTCSPWSGDGGNARLRPWIADALDLSVEKYFGPEAYVSAAGFYKKLKTYIYEQNVLMDFTGFPIRGNVEPVLREGFVKIWSNGEGGNLYGFELTGSLPFSAFTPALEGFGVQGSYSYTESEITPNPGDPAQPLPGLSKHVWNVTAYFERSGFSVRGSARHRSSFLAETKGFGGSLERRYANGETIVDAQIGYEFQEGSALEGLSLLAQVYNLTNEPFSTYFIPDQRLVRDHEEYGRRFLFGVNYRF
ncbi:TonB-dependent receptor [Sandaracinobacteroides hominis]|uniref:TonB-dependent receptor n=1 Tax=Sandaracinobacteroides hominis TaxID=2780086 RepID=UPI001F412B90|nr:TonB-dependent receptor [Sandaracinobacteroides hominis]